MQKKLLSVAVAGALAAPGAALAQVEVYGFISVAVSKFKYSAATVGGVTAPSVSKFDVSSHGSNYGVRGRENLGGGTPRSACRAPGVTSLSASGQRRGRTWNRCGRSVRWAVIAPRSRSSGVAKQPVLRRTRTALTAIFLAAKVRLPL